LAISYLSFKISTLMMTTFRDNIDAATSGPDPEILGIVVLALGADGKYRFRLRFTIANEVFVLRCAALRCS
jgi:hypothetical protein